MTNAGDIFRTNIRRFRMAYITGTLALTLTAIDEVFGPKFAQWTIDLLSPSAGMSTIPGYFQRGSTEESLASIAIAFGMLLSFGWIGRWAWRETLARRTHQSERDIKVSMWDVLRWQPLKLFHKYTVGDLISRGAGDLLQARNLFGFSLVLTYDLIFFGSMAVVAMALISLKLTLLTLIVFPFMAMLIQRLSKIEYTQYLWAQERLSFLSDLISQVVSTIRMQRSTATDGLWNKKLGEAADDYAQRRYAALKTDVKMFPVGAGLTLFAYVIILTFGVRTLQAGEITPGGFVALLSYVVLLQNPLFEIGECIGDWQRGLASLRRIVEILNLQDKTRVVQGALLADDSVARAGTSAGRESATLVVNDLSFSYPGSTAGRRILQNIHLKIAPGQIVGIMGPVGSGKSTVAQAIAGLVEVAPRQIYVCGQDVATLSRQDIVERVVVVPQKTFLFAGTVRDNLCLDEDMSDEVLWDMLTVVGMKSEVQGFSDGLSSVIGERGINLSGGQKQRLALARALLRPKPLLILDDCVSAVDAQTEEYILAGMRSRFKDVAVIWIAHRLSTLRHCERVYAMVNGTMAHVPHGGVADHVTGGIGGKHDQST